MAKSELFERNASRVADLVEQIPPGRCMTYGGIGKVIGIVPRYVALIMATAEEIHGTPWHRVVGAGGVVKGGAHRTEQVRRLRAEGVSLDGSRIIDFAEKVYAPE